MKRKVIGHFIKVIGSSLLELTVVAQIVFYLREANVMAAGTLRTTVSLAITVGSILTIYSMLNLLRKTTFHMPLTALIPRCRKGEKWLLSLSFWIPRKYREAIRGDILEDCHEMREKGFTETRILIHVLWQFVIAVIALWPETVGSALATIVKRIWKIKQ